MAAGTFTLFDHVAKAIADGTIDLDSHTFNLILLTSSYSPNAAHDEYSDLSGSEVAEASGYETGGQALTGVTFNRTGGVAKFDSDDVVWEADGGSITARYAAMLDVSVSPVKAIGYLLLDATPADLTATDGNTMTVGPDPTNGWFQLEVNPS